MIFKLRGQTLDNLPARLGESFEGAVSELASESQEEEVLGEQSSSLPPAPLPDDPARFRGSTTKTEETLPVFIPENHGALPQRLGAFPSWRGREDFLQGLEAVYRRWSAAGLKVYLGVSE